VPFRDRRLDECDAVIASAVDESQAPGTVEHDHAWNGFERFRRGEGDSRLVGQSVARPRDKLIVGVEEIRGIRRVELEARDRPFLPGLTVARLFPQTRSA